MRETERDVWRGLSGKRSVDQNEIGGSMHSIHRELELLYTRAKNQRDQKQCRAWGNLTAGMKARDEEMMSFPRRICTHLSNSIERTRERRRKVVCISAKTDSASRPVFGG